MKGKDIEIKVMPVLNLLGLYLGKVMNKKIKVSMLFYKFPQKTTK